jgi:DNA-binding protein YbaB
VAKVLEGILSIRARMEEFQRERAAKQQRIADLKTQGHVGAIRAYIQGTDEFPSISEVKALEVDIEELDIRIRAARQATEELAGQYHQAQAQNREAWIEVLKTREQALMNQWQEIQAHAQKIQEDWRAHATMVETITGERVFSDFSHPSRPLLTREADDVVISTQTAGSIT